MTEGNKKSAVKCFGIVGNHVLDRGQVNTAEWIYTVGVVNSSTTVFSEITVVYTKTNLVGSIVLSQGITLPGVQRTFRLCPCGELSEFVIGLFWYDAAGVLFSEAIPPTGSFQPPIGSQPCSVIIDITDVGVS